MKLELKWKCQEIYYLDIYQMGKFMGMVKNYSTTLYQLDSVGR